MVDGCCASPRKGGQTQCGAAAEEGFFHAVVPAAAGDGQAEGAAGGDDAAVVGRVGARREHEIQPGELLLHFGREGDRAKIGDGDAGAAPAADFEPGPEKSTLHPEGQGRGGLLWRAPAKLPRERPVWCGPATARWIRAELSSGWYSMKFLL